jgi:hypothetical protein
MNLEFGIVSRSAYDLVLAPYPSLAESTAAGLEQ